jgi:Heparinase II/III-like protein
VLADPGTYCYHGEPRWRSYFRSTLAHNTIEVSHQDQSTSGGPFLWTRHARSDLSELKTNADGEITYWSAKHDGYGALTPPVLHRRSVRLASQDRRIEIVDCLETTGRHAFRLAFHFGPAIDAKMVEGRVELTWSNGTSTRATLSLPEGPSWSLARGRTDPVLGWYSARFGQKQPSWTVIGEGACSGTGSDTFSTLLQFDIASPSSAAD